MTTDKMTRVSDENHDIKQNWREVNANPPEPTCDINDLILWCPENEFGCELMLGGFKDGEFQAFNQATDEFIKIEPTHWMPAPHLGPNSENKIQLLAGA